VLSEVLEASLNLLSLLLLLLSLPWSLALPFPLLAIRVLRRTEDDSRGASSRAVADPLAAVAGGLAAFFCFLDVERVASSSPGLTKMSSKRAALGRFLVFADRSPRPVAAAEVAEKEAGWAGEESGSEESEEEEEE
jgi:hypothetical protein